MKIKETPIIGGNAEKEIFTPTGVTNTMATSVGLPDDRDIENIKAAMRQYNTVRPGEIQAHIKKAKKEQQMLANEDGSNMRFGESKNKAYFRRSLTMPIGLYRMIDDAYPLMFTDKRHLHWFMRNFPMFNVARRI